MVGRVGVGGSRGRDGVAMVESSAGIGMGGVGLVGVTGVEGTPPQKRTILVKKHA